MFKLLVGLFGSATVNPVASPLVLVITLQLPGAPPFKILASIFMVTSSLGFAHSVAPESLPSCLITIIFLVATVEHPVSVIVQVKSYSPSPLNLMSEVGLVSSSIAIAPPTDDTISHLPVSRP